MPRKKSQRTNPKVSEASPVFEADVNESAIAEDTDVIDVVEDVEVKEPELSVDEYCQRLHETAHLDLGNLNNLSAEECIHIAIDYAATSRTIVFNTMSGSWLPPFPTDAKVKNHSVALDKSHPEDQVKLLSLAVAYLSESMVKILKQNAQ